MKDKQVRVYIITTGDKGRLYRLKNQLGELDYSYVISAPMRELNKLEIEWRSKSHKFRQKAIMAGEIGCFKTHRDAWKEIAESGEAGIIIEDNIDFMCKPDALNHPDFLSQIKQCGLICFTDFRYRADYEKPFIVSSLKEKRPFPTVCYGITPERAANLVRAADKTGFVLPVDKWLSIPELCGVYGYISNLTVAKRKTGLASIANRKRGKKTFNPINMVFWAINKIKYGY